MRRGVLRGLVACLASLAFAAPAGAAPPNIVLIVTDDQRWDTLQYMPTVQSELVGRGVNFENAFVTNPLCCPSRVSILTGAYSHTTGVYRNSDFDLFRDESTVATWLDAAGYETGLFGKYLNRYPGSFVPPGWDRWVAFAPIGYYSYGFTVDGELTAFGEREMYSTDFFAAEALAFLSAAPRPFFLYFAPYAPHKPATPAERHQTTFAELPLWRPPSYNERDVSDKPPWVRSRARLDAAERAALDALRREQIRSLLAVDEAVGSFLEALASSGDLANTIIVFMTDNGYLWGEHRLRGKWYPYEESIRTPFVVRYDAMIGTPRNEPHHVLGIDVAPTFAELAGVPAPGSDGQSILPLLSGDESVSWRSRFLVEGQRPYCAMRTARYSFVIYGSGHIELYDMAFDPNQLQNLANARGFRAKVASLRKGLARLCNPPAPGLSRKLLCTHTGTDGADLLVASARYDIVCARGGGDQIDAGDAGDYVYAEGGNDRVYARDGFVDVIRCGSGDDLAVVDSSDRLGADCERVRRS